MFLGHWEDSDTWALGIQRCTEVEEKIKVREKAASWEMYILFPKQNRKTTALCRIKEDSGDIRI